MLVTLRIAFHMAAIAVSLAVIDQVFRNQYVPLVHLLLNWLRPGYFLVFAATVACIINRRPALLAMLLGLGFLLTYQDIKHDLFAPATAVLIGAVIARAVLALANEGHEEEP
jgi:hypothetical protein